MCSIWARAAFVELPPISSLSISPTCAVYSAVIGAPLVLPWVFSRQIRRVATERRNPGPCGDVLSLAQMELASAQTTREVEPPVLLLYGSKDAMIRMSYSRNPDGSVRQHGEQSTDHGLNWSTNFDFTYHPKTKPTP